MSNFDGEKDRLLERLRVCPEMLVVILYLAIIGRHDYAILRWLQLFGQFLSPIRDL